MCRKLSSVLRITFRKSIWQGEGRNGICYSTNLDMDIQTERLLLIDWSLNWFTAIIDWRIGSLIDWCHKFSFIWLIHLVRFKYIIEWLVDWLIEAERNMLTFRQNDVPYNSGVRVPTGSPTAISLSATKSPNPTRLLRFVRWHCADNSDGPMSTNSPQNDTARDAIALLRFVARAECHGRVVGDETAQNVVEHGLVG